MAGAIGWGALAAASVVLGALLGIVREWPGRGVGLVLGFGAGALISAISFDLADEALKAGGAVAIGLALGALTYYGLDRLVDRHVGHDRPRGHDPGDPGTALLLGAFLDGIPEQLALGLTIATGDGVSVALLAAIFVSNLPEAIGSVAGMRRHRGARQILGLWAAVAIISVGATALGYGVLQDLGGEVAGIIQGFAAGALLVMLVDAMVPDARRLAGRSTGLATVLGFALAAGLSNLG